MTRKLLASTVIPLLFATSAIAQTTSTDSTMGHSWSDTTAEAFFTDDGSMTLRSEAEIGTSWEELTEEERTMVRDECASMEQDSAATGSGTTDSSTTSDSSTTGTATTDTTTDTTTGATSDSTTTGSATTDTTMAGTGTLMEGITGGEVTQASWEELCTIVGGL